MKMTYKLDFIISKAELTKFTFYFMNFYMYIDIVMIDYNKKIK